MFPRTALLILGLLVTSIVLIVWSGYPFQHSLAQMAAGKAYMDSLTEKDIQVWIDRTNTLLSEYEPGTYPIGVYGSGSKPIPPELAELKIIRIDMSENRVNYVWLGGLDHTDLEVQRMSDGNFRFTARYNDARSRVIWPKE